MDCRSIDAGSTSSVPRSMIMSMIGQPGTMRRRWMPGSKFVASQSQKSNIRDSGGIEQS